jgi:hypothetical protein
MRSLAYFAWHSEVLRVGTASKLKGASVRQEVFLLYSCAQMRMTQVYITDEFLTSKRNRHWSHQWHGLRIETRTFFKGQINDLGRLEAGNYKKE